MIHSKEDQPDAETEHFTKVNRHDLRPFFSIFVDQIDSQLQKSIKIDNHKKASERFLSTSDINRLISIDYHRLSSIFIEYRKYRLGTSWLQTSAGKLTSRCSEYFRSFIVENINMRGGKTHKFPK